MTFVSTRFRVMVALTFGVYFVMASRSHFGLMLVDVTQNGTDYTYSAMNAVYQVAYASVQVPLSLWADHADPVSALGVVPFGIGVTSVVAPFTLPVVSSSAVSAAITGTLFAINGALSGSWWPFMNVMLSNWAPPDELAYMYAVINTGVPGGSALGNLFTGLAYSVHNSTFLYSFFVVSIVGILWCITWFCKFYSYPFNDPKIQLEELEYLNANIQPKTTLAVPWRKIATSIPVWTIIIANYGSTILYTVIIMYMPMYLQKEMKMEITKNGFMSAMSPLCQMFVMYLTGYCASLMHSKKWMGVTNIRKVFTFIGMLVPAGLLLMAPFCVNNNYVFYGMLVMAYAISGSVFSGFRVTQMEIAPNFVATITAILDLVGSFAMFSTHIFFMVIFKKTAERIMWSHICWILSGILIICASPFILLGNSTSQSWN